MPRNTQKDSSDSKEHVRKKSLQQTGYIPILVFSSAAGTLTLGDLLTKHYLETLFPFSYIFLN